MKISDEAIRLAAAVIKNGGLAAFPTETVYGLGADAFNPSALAKIFEAKNRPRFDPLIIHIAEFDTLEKVADVSLLDFGAKNILNILAKHFWPGPLTLILPKQQAVPGLATSGLPTVAVRIPGHDAARQLIALSTGAVAAPSANPFGYLSPTSAEHVLAMLGEKAEIILDGGPALVGVESTVLDICHGPPRILRPGGIPKEAIEELIGPVATGATDAAESDTSGLSSPGMLKSHYAPHARLSVHTGESIRSLPAESGAAFLFFDGASRDHWLRSHRLKGQPQPEQKPIIAVLSETGNIIEAAANFFRLLHELDRPGIKKIFAQLAPEESLGIAINDRLQRASCA